MMKHELSRLLQVQDLQERLLEQIFLFNLKNWIMLVLGHQAICL